MNMSSQKSRRSDKIKIEFPFTDHVIYSRVIYVIYRVVSIVVEIEHMAVIPFGRGGGRPSHPLNSVPTPFN